MSRGRDGFYSLWLAFVVFIFPLTQLIALRNLLLLLGLISLATGFRQAPRPVLVSWLKHAALALAVLTAWIAVQAVVLALEPAAALDQLRANWLQPLLVGALAALIAARIPVTWALRAIITGLSAHLAWVFIHQFGIAVHTGIWPLGLMPFAGRDYQSLIVGFLASLLIAERLSWLMRSDSPPAWSARTGWIFLFFVLAGDVLIRTRNGAIVIVVLVIAATGLSLVSSRLRLRWRGMVVIGAVLVAILSSLSIQGDRRWHGLGESTKIGWTDTGTYWLTGSPTSLPPTPSGAPLEESAYMRAAWARQAVDFITEYPLGIGFAHDAFGHALALKHGVSGWGSSHSGWLDFALGAGIPGLVLLLFTAALAVRGGWKQFRWDRDGVGLLFGFLVGGYLLRCLLDGHLSGWRLGLFALLAGTLIGCMRRRA